MDPHVAVMGGSPWRVTTSDGRVFDERQCLWPDLPADIVISQMLCVGQLFRGFRGYGFQRYQVSTVAGRPLSAGLQVICVVDDSHVLITDMDMGSGLRESRSAPIAELTYNRELLRAGR